MLRFMTRPRFWYLVRLFVVSGILGLVPGRSEAEEQPVLRFVQWNDTHISVGPTYELANEKFDYLISATNAGSNFPRPDFVIAVGDMIHGTKGIDSLVADCALLQQKLAELKCPFYPVIGNHEDIQREGDPAHQAPYKATFGKDRLNYTFRAGGILFIVLDDTGAPKSNKTTVGRSRNQWLGKVLETSPDTPTIVCCHIPLVPLREDEVLKKSFGFNSYMAGDDDLLKLIDSHSEHIIAVLSGHLHLTGVVQRKGIYHITISGTASYPCDYAVYEVYPDRIGICVQSLSKELLTPNTNIHGKPRYKTGFTDTKHPTAESYIRGNPAERKFNIRLEGKKRLGSGEHL